MRDHPGQRQRASVDRGLIDIDGLITRHYGLDDINKAYDELEGDGVGRGVIVF